MERNTFITPSLIRAFVVTFVFVTLASGLFWLDTFRGYNAEIAVLVVSKTNTHTSEDVADTLAELTRTLSFYTRVLADNDLIEDDFAGFPSDERKALWNERVSVRQQNGGSVLVIRATGETTGQTKLLAEQTAQTLFSVAGIYFNVRTEIDLRVIDGPFVVYELQKPYQFVVYSLATSLFVTTIFFFFLRVVPELLRKKKRQSPEVEAETPDESLPKHAYPEFHTGDSVPWIDPKKFIPAKPQMLSFENTEEETQYTESAPRFVSHAPAPMNLPTASDELDLPVADTSLPFTFEAQPKENEIFVADEDVVVPSEMSAESTPHEPTQEEYKRRLNELLANMDK